MKCSIQDRAAELEGTSRMERSGAEAKTRDSYERQVGSCQVGGQIGRERSGLRGEGELRVRREELAGWSDKKLGIGGLEGAGRSSNEAGVGRKPGRVGANWNKVESRRSTGATEKKKEMEEANLKLEGVEAES